MNKLVFKKLTLLVNFTFIFLISSCVNNYKSIITLGETYKSVLSKMDSYQAKNYAISLLLPNDEKGETPIVEGFELQNGVKYLLVFYVKIDDEGKEVGGKTLGAIFKESKESYKKLEFKNRVEFLNLKDHLKEQ